MQRGGARPGAGRKRDLEFAAVHALIGSAVSDDDWLKIFKLMAQSKKLNLPNPCRASFGAAGAAVVAAVTGSPAVARAPEKVPS